MYLYLLVSFQSILHPRNLCNRQIGTLLINVTKNIVSRIKTNSLPWPLRLYGLESFLLLQPQLVPVCPNFLCFWYTELTLVSSNLSDRSQLKYYFSLRLLELGELTIPFLSGFLLKHQLEFPYWLNLIESVVWVLKLKWGNWM